MRACLGRSCGCPWHARGACQTWDTPHTALPRRVIGSSTDGRAACALRRSRDNPPGRGSACYPGASLGPALINIRATAGEKCNNHKALLARPEGIRTSDPQIRSLVLYRDADHRLRSGFSAKAPNRETSPPGEGRKALSPSRIDHPVTTETSSERFRHQNGRELATTGRYRTGRIGTRGRFSQYKSKPLGTEQNGSGRPSTNFECRASTAQRTFHGCKEVHWFGRLRASSCAAPKRWDERWFGGSERESYNDINGVGRTPPQPASQSLTHPELGRAWRRSNHFFRRRIRAM